MAFACLFVRGVLSLFLDAYFTISTAATGQFENK